MNSPKLHADILNIDCEAEANRIAARMVEIVGSELRRRGVIIAISGGVDSAVCAALAVRALGTSKVFGLMLPERDSSSNSLTRGVLRSRLRAWREYEPRVTNSANSPSPSVPRSWLTSGSPTCAVCRLHWILIIGGWNPS